MDLSKLYGQSTPTSTVSKAVNEACYKTVGGNDPHLHCFTAFFKDGSAISYMYSQLVAVTYRPEGRIVVQFLDRDLGQLEIQGTNLKPIAEALARHRLESVTEGVRAEFGSGSTLISAINV